MKPFQVSYKLSFILLYFTSQKKKIVYSFVLTDFIKYLHINKINIKSNVVYNFNENHVL